MYIVFALCNILSPCAKRCSLYNLCVSVVCCVCLIIPAIVWEEREQMCGLWCGRCESNITITLWSDVYACMSGRNSSSWAVIWVYKIHTCAAAACYSLCSYDARRIKSRCNTSGGGEYFILLPWLCGGKYILCSVCVYSLWESNERAQDVELLFTQIPSKVLPPLPWLLVLCADVFCMCVPHNCVA